MTGALLRTPFHDVHVGFGGRMVEFAGWELPIMFAGVTKEHVHTRTACSAFDVSHMGRLKVTGPDADIFLNRVCTRNLSDPEVGRSYYTHICREDGGILDDVIASRFESWWGIVCNGANREKIVAWLNKQGESFEVELEDQTLATAMLALQGPETIELAGKLGGFDLTSLKRYRFVVKEILGIPIALYRSGYTGEDGLEIVVPAPVATMLAPQLLGSPDQPHPVIRPAGLGARDTLRIEAAMPLYGHELSENVDPLTAGQGWCVDQSGDFVGADALRRIEKDRRRKKLVGLVLDGRRIARQHQRILADGCEVGKITSGTLSPTLGASIAMGFVAADAAAVDTALEVDLGSKHAGARVVKLPFYKRPKSK